MKTSVPYHIKKLRSEFECRKKKNSSYSLRAFARFIGLEAPSLSAVLKGKRRVSKNKINSVMNKLDLSPQEMSTFKESNFSAIDRGQQEIPELEFMLKEETHFNVIADWEHSAILSLIETENFKHSIKWMSHRLGIDEYRIQVCLENLIDCQMIEYKNKKYVLTKKSTFTTEDVPSRALRKARRQDLKLVESAIDEVRVELRDLSAATLTVDVDELDELKKIIRQFRRSFMKRAERVSGQEVYKLSMQFIPLTKVTDKRSRK